MQVRFRFVLPFTSNGIRRTSRIATGALIGAASLAVAAMPAHADTLGAWGFNPYGELGNGMQGLGPAGTGIYSTTLVYPIGLGNNVTSTGAAIESSFAIQSGALYSWGLPVVGQLGYTSSSNVSTPTPVPNLSTGVIAVAGGGDHAIAIVQGGALYSWGLNAYGQLGNGHYDAVIIGNPMPAPVVNMSSGVTAIACGLYHSMAVQNGTLYAWGQNAGGQIGNGMNSPTGYITTPFAVPNMSGGITAIAAGHYQSAAVKNGALYTWGFNDSGQLGQGTYDILNSNPTPVPNLSSGVTSISVGDEHMLALQNGNVFAWGLNSSGQLGQGFADYNPVISPIPVTGFNDPIISVAASYASSFALSSDGSAWSWGLNSHGELETGNTINYSTPQHLRAPAGMKFTSLTTNGDGYTVLVTMALATPGNLVYTNSSGNGMFDTSSANFNNGSAIVAYDDYSSGTTGDNVTFNDTASPGYNVSIPSVVSPSSVTVNTNNSPGYLFSGAGGISGTGGLTKLGSGVLTLAVSNSYIGGTNISGGTVVLAVANALPAGGNLTVASGATLFANTLSTTTALSVGTLSLSGKLDLNTNALIVHNSSIGSINTLVQTGFNNGRWNNSIGITSLAASTDPSHLTALGAIVNDNGSGTPLYGTSGTLATTFEGSLPVDGDVLIKYTYYGDTNLDGKVDGSDYSRIDNGFLNQLTGWSNGDFNYDGKVDGSDYTLIDNAFNSQGAAIAGQIGAPSAIATAQIAGTSAVPEPTSISLLGLGTIALLARRRRD